ncbi:MAG: GNAT family N-acetyltransferase [Ardenticatenaceae bacterium]|nr:GNAT family N-acetyltransferase [Ardenticatenaceae bacterium]HBY98831.1 hypothetical protein [Chloroflexota bacterium]
MVSQSIPRDADTRAGHLRPLDPARDLGPLAHLIEIAFADELSFGATAIAREIQAQSLFGPIFWLLSRISPTFRELLTGFVWEEDGTLVGNTTISRADGIANDWIISNVAVLPSYRRRGIADQLVGAAIEYARQRRARRILLQVRADNEAARRLYLKHGFVTVEVVTQLQASRMIPPRWQPNPSVVIRAPVPARWYEAYELARVAIPIAVQQLRPLRADTFHIRLRGSLDTIAEWLTGRSRERWWAEVDGRLRGLLTIERGRGTSRIEFIIHPEGRGLVEPDLTRHALERLRGNTKVRAHVPTYQAEVINSLRKCGFVEVRSLEQMVLEVQKLGERQ